MRFIRHYRFQRNVQKFSLLFLMGLITSMMVGCEAYLLGGSDSAASAAEDSSNHDSSPLLNSPPVFTSESNITSHENVKTVATITAGDAENKDLIFGIDGGPDADRFVIDSQSGTLRFSEAPDFEAPLDENANNTYVVGVTASDGENTTRQTFVVSVIDYPITAIDPTGYVKTLKLDWPAVEGVTHYKLYVSPDGGSEYAQVGTDIGTFSTDITLPVHLTNWNDSRYLVEGYNDQGFVFRSDPTTIHKLYTIVTSDLSEVMLDSIGYIKASNTGKSDNFGGSVTLSADGQTLVVGAPREPSAATGVDGDQGDNTDEGAGAVYVYIRVGTAWTQQAYIKASNTEARDEFGSSVALSSDGHILVVGAPEESSAATGVNGDQGDNAADGAGAVYVYTRAEGVWTQQAYVKASNTGANDGFGNSVALSTDGQTLAVGAWGENSAATGIDGDQNDNSAIDSGAVYVYSRADAVWSQQAYIKASNTGTNDLFGASVALSADGQTLAVGADGEDSASVGIDANQDDNSNDDSGAVYVYARAGGGWNQQAYVKASNTSSLDLFGTSVALSANGEILVVGAPQEASASTGVDGDQSDNSAVGAGAVYVYTRAGSVWTQQAYIKASNTDEGDFFGNDVALSADGKILVVGARGENSAAIGVGGDQRDNSAADAGAAYVYIQAGAMWTQLTYVKAANTGAGDLFGNRVALSADAQTLVVGAPNEDSAAAGIDGAQDDNSAGGSGAVYLF